MKLFHLSDLHIGKIVNGYEMWEDQRYVFDQILAYVREEQPDAVMIAGDIYDKAVPSAKAVTEFDEDNPFFEKVCVFTGVLEKMKRSDAAQLVVDLGGICGNSVTKKTNYLILGNNDYCPTIRDGKSTKQKKAEELKLKGNDIEIISENTFYDMLNM